eukprot:CAMPEP_0195063766 /NCGR_PEP_ID=MMETSP0448-20130528/10062_1 /TAXON_ID=66468 /ORGANISM="Heterocapsa triquestra, Strain CCMP 448" /LENGTH=251 /DNA_ID=CAMNT_0040094711 /DNA_START=50 /DNA_END=803 /DNA_ORIENTATION=+
MPIVMRATMVPSPMLLLPPAPASTAMCRGSSCQSTTSTQTRVTQLSETLSPKSSSDRESWQSSGCSSPANCSAFDSSCALQYKIKNTFIDDFAEDGEEDVSTCVGRYDSCPAIVLGSSGAKEEPDSIHSAVLIEPLGVRQPAQSAGSWAHCYGACRPCGFYWRELGCINGAACRHCHQCTFEEGKKRKKQLLKAKRMAAAAAVEEHTCAVRSLRSRSAHMCARDLRPACQERPCHARALHHDITIGWGGAG